MIEEKAKELVRLNKKIHKLKTLLTTLEEERRVVKKEYEKMDRASAMKDGRFKKLNPQGGEKRTVKAKLEVHPKDMTREQIYQLAKKLGVSL